MPVGFANVELTTSDGVHLVGALAGSGTTGIVLAHQRNGDGCGWLDYGARLASHGMVLAPDLRGFGGSDEGQGDGETRYDLDVVAAADELKRRGATRIVLMGASIGGTTVILAAPELDSGAGGRRRPLAAGRHRRPLGGGRLRGRDLDDDHRRGRGRPRVRGELARAGRRRRRARSSS